MREIKSQSQMRTGAHETARTLQILGDATAMGLDPQGQTVLGLGGSHRLQQRLRRFVFAQLEVHPVGTRVRRLRNLLGDGNGSAQDRGGRPAQAETAAALQPVGLGEAAEYRSKASARDPFQPFLLGKVQSAARPPRLLQPHDHAETPAGGTPSQRSFT